MGEQKGLFYLVVSLFHVFLLPEIKIFTLLSRVILFHHEKDGAIRLGPYHGLSTFLKIKAENGM